MEIYGGEKGKILLFNVDRLNHAVEADIKRPFTGHDKVRVSQTVGGQIVGEHTEERPTATLSTHILKKLRAKVIFSLRRDLEVTGDVDLADKLIFK